MKGNQISLAIQRARYVATDLVTTALAIFTFNIFRYFLMEIHVRGHLTLGEFLSMPTVVIEQILLPFILLGIYWWSGYYNRPFSKSRVEEFHSTMVSSVVSTALIYFALLINDPLPARTLTYEVVIVLWGCLFLFTYIGRLILTTSSIRHMQRRDWMFNTVIIGNSPHAINTARRLQEQPTNMGYNVVGHVPIEGEPASTENHNALDDRQVERLARTHNIDQIVLVPTQGSPEEKVMQLLFKYFPTGVPIRLAPTSMAFFTSHIKLGDIISEPMIDLTSPAMNDLQRNTKRIMDVLLSGTALILLSPLYLALAIAVKSTSPGPVIYRQERVGYRQRPFNILKFRSMRVDAEANGPQLSDDTDPRITPLGRVMRKYRLDELPQFWNVFKGEMSLVGPRPERAFFIEQIVREAPYYTLIHQVKPGITSWGMVKFGYARSVPEMVERTRYDLIYLSNMSVAVDIKILLHTIKTVVMGKGV
ncbi:MAG: sugar transferase [Muribaculaceae bacterium]|nr:sugar transferase [Muribaculaceae bacterium]